MATPHDKHPAKAADNSLSHLGDVMQKYANEASKRLALRPEGTAQFLELKAAESERFRSLSQDPWDVDSDVSEPPALTDGSHCKFLILGAGFGGILLAVRLIQAGFAAEDIRLVDSAGGFGGTWYWNRYPGLHCDVDSSIYLPLLEETGYVPKSKYSSGVEILEHVNRIVAQWRLGDKCLFRTEAKRVTWDDDQRLWSTKMTQHRGSGREPLEIGVTSQYVLVASGVLTRPQVPKIPYLDKFAGHMFHTARFDYFVTGGSPTEPKLTKLGDKRVGIIGTGATAIQVAPALARWCKELYVFQRTPSAVHWRGQRDTNMDEWKTQVATKEGWQLERMANFTTFTNVAYGQAPQHQNMIADAWTEIPSLGAITGSPVVTSLRPEPEQIAEHIGKLNALDLPITERVRARVDDIVKNPEVAQRLKAFYPSWCKRPTYSDEYLQCFNQPNVTLVDTDGRGVESASKTGLVFNGKEYPLDVLVLCTGYITPAAGNGSPMARMGITVQGKNGLNFDDKWQNRAATLHGIMTHDFPNMFFIGPSQAGSASNFMEPIMNLSRHVSFIVSEAEKASARGDGLTNARDKETRVVIEVTEAAEEAWTMECMKRAAGYSVVSLCTPGYITSEGDSTRKMATAGPEEIMKLSRIVGWGEGMGSFLETIREWRLEGSLPGVEVYT